MILLMGLALIRLVVMRGRKHALARHDYSGAEIIRFHVLAGFRY